MSRKKGEKKTGGREKGTPNKITSDFKNFVGDLIIENADQIKKDMKNIEPEKRLIFFEKMLNYVLPKAQTIEIKEEPQNHEIIYIGYGD